MWTRLLLTTLCVLSVMATRPLMAADAGVHLELKHYLDGNCDGAAELAARAIPGSCLIYEVTATNRRTVPLRDVKISAAIPKHTTLVKSYYYAQDGVALDSEVAQDQLGERSISARLAAIAPGVAQRVVLRYVVRIQ